ncbi:hypothetical protein ASPWEDRAFT_716644 [Aspergillus wentii DTO 134E9]|uniref:Transmembrane protein n=1 Tax=Aspergillus wentii DTO 134E9 TaxID=1073089 RepID=A0A1L9R6G6_ASPWE|nr:uncharacterized protein ASPWEDRAFT_716644 [Aspergillus wentii DTO 134E9]OJJ30515.1 hypothetical protein ASPWEDRAFT_716644 [Aspergillus wentii DTO 134E9]
MILCFGWELNCSGENRKKQKRRCGGARRREKSGRRKRNYLLLTTTIGSIIIRIIILHFTAESLILVFLLIPTASRPDGSVRLHQVEERRTWVPTTVEPKEYWLFGSFYMRIRSKSGWMMRFNSRLIKVMPSDAEMVRLKT